MIVSLVRKVFKFSAFFLFLLIGITFCVSNRESIKLTFYPLPFELTLPLFLFTMIILIAGILFGWFYTHIMVIRLRIQSRQFVKKIGALENELKALHTEQLIQQPVASIPKK